MDTAAGFGLLMLGLTLFGMIKKLGLIAYAIWFDMNYPEASRRLLRRYEDNARGSFLIGLCIGLPATIAGGVLVYLGSGVFLVAGIVLLALILSLLVYGHGALYHAHALRRGGVFGAASPPTQILVSGILLEFMFLAPFVGQAIAAILWMRGFGAAVLALASKSEDSKTSEPAEPTRAT